MWNFYPRSPCGERPCTTTITICTASFLSTLSLRRATRCQALDISIKRISIHALLAESDRALRQLQSALCHFYPRSPCGERHQNIANGKRQKNISIHALLAESDSLRALLICPPPDFYPRSPCGERLPYLGRYIGSNRTFLSTLSLRRATRLGLLGWLRVLISIHALLAESD